ncbi:dihydrolipoamide acetyltransferase family protein [Arthrobacter mangrovi]|uniref:Dihydrolipoamide acetyltransferase component of pyruvate dehydrogenase complex n=1 Tax=Arthrobacter mangrovi TaxID=2966350 RepID=A0ABQ5MZ80_9MICC|nr:dihydrolipoamide acetyltransferase family protein [Arthrobacter mangrovi]GLB69277.1 acetyltransferase component of pyruvate dehydrogenase complex [Arthrobacter mangrovi]
MSEIFMPRLSDTMEEGVIARWTKKPGDAVKAGEVIAEIDTDKATMELEVFEDGVIEQLLVEEGATVPIGQVVALVGPGAGGGTGGTTTAAPAAAAPEGPAAREPGTRVPMSPLARKIAREHGIDPDTLAGSGPGGRVVRQDVEAAIAALAPGGGAASAPGTGAPQATPAAPSGTGSKAAPAGGPPPPAVVAGPAAAAVPAAGTTAGAAADATEIPLTQMRKATARRLTESAAVPHFDLTIPVTVDPLLAFRADINARLAEDGVKVSVTDLLVRAVAVTLRRHPKVNSSWDGDRILQHRRVHVGMAVAIEAGLIVPVIRDADAKGLSVLARESKELAEKARAGKLRPEEFSGGTFTLSNLGMFGIEQFTAVINPPEAAILAVGASVAEPYVEEGALRERTVIRLTMTSDHRVLDGAVSAGFLRDLKQTLEEPLRILL